MKTGIYQIRNINNDHIYLGSAQRSFNIRWNGHIYLLRKNKHHSIHLQHAWNLYGEINFVFEIIEEIEPDKCLEREQFYLDSLKPRYNINKNAHSRKGTKMSAESRMKMSVAKTGKKFKYTITEKRLALWESLKNQKPSELALKRFLEKYKGVKNFSKTFPIVAINATDKTITYYASIPVASEKLKIKRSGIANVIYGLAKTSGNHYFFKLDKFIAHENLEDII